MAAAISDASILSAIANAWPLYYEREGEVRVSKDDRRVILITGFVDWLLGDGGVLLNEVCELCAYCGAAPTRSAPAEFGTHLLVSFYGISQCKCTFIHFGVPKAVLTEPDELSMRPRSPRRRESNTHPMS